MDLSASWKGSNDDPIAILVDAASGSFLTGGGSGAFLKDGNFDLDFGAEKNDESAFVTVAGANTAFAVPGSFLTIGFVDDGPPTAGFLAGCAGLAVAGAGSSLRFLESAAASKIQGKVIRE